MCCTTFSLGCHFWQCPWDLGSVPAERAGQGVSTLGPDSMAASGLSCRKALVGYSGYIRHETFSFMMSLPAMSLGLRFCVSRKGRTGGGGWVSPKGANSMAASGLVFRSDLAGTGRAISILFGIKLMELETSNLTL